MKNLLLLLTTIVVAIAFSGCGMKQNELGYYVPSSKEELAETKKIKIYFKDYTTVGTKKTLLKLKDLIENSKYSYDYKYKVSFTIFTYDYDTNFNYIPTEVKGYPGYSFSRYNYLYNSFRFSGSGFKNDIDVDTIKKVNNPFDFKLTYKDGVLVSNKKYANYNDIINDMSRIALFLRMKYEEDPKFTSKYNSSHVMVLDDSYVKQHKLGFSLKRKISNRAKRVKKQLETYGYTLVDKKEDADKIILFETSPSFTGYELKNNKDIKLLSNINSVSNYSDIGNTTMKLTNAAGHSSLHSAQAGLLVFGLLSLLSSDNLPYRSYTQIKIINSKTGLAQNITLALPSMVYPSEYYMYTESLCEDLLNQLKTDEYKHFRNQVAYRFERIKI